LEIFVIYGAFLGGIPLFTMGENTFPDRIGAGVRCFFSENHTSKLNLFQRYKDTFLWIPFNLYPDSADIIATFCGGKFPI